jgi:hypothetical protein
MRTRTVIIMNAAEDARSLCDALEVALDANVGMPADPDERVLDAEGLAAKCLFHANSCLLLAGGTPVGKGATRVLDLGSLNVLVRATLESSLAFHHLFASSQHSAQIEFRYLRWVLADLLERQDFPASSPDSQQTQTEELQQIKEIRSRLQANGEFQGLTPKQRKRVLEEGHWNPGWATVARDAGLSELHATLVHRYLCSYAHSGSMSVLQLRQAKTCEDRERFLATALRLVSIALALITRAYCSAFPRAAQALGQHREFSSKVDDWIQVGGEA